MKYILACLVLIAPLIGCASGKLNRVELVSPHESREAAFEDASVGAEISVTDDSALRLRLVNRSPGRISILWENCAFVNASGECEKAGYIFKKGKGVSDSGGITALDPGESAVLDVFPAANRYKDEKGRELVHPLYNKGTYESMVGKVVGVDLVMEVNDRARQYRFLVRLGHSVF